FGGIHGQVKSFLGTDSAESECVVASPGGEVGGGNFDTVLKGGEEVGALRGTLVLREGNTMKPEVRRIERPNGIGIPVRREMERGEDRQACFRHVFVKIDAVQMDQVHLEAAESFLD